MAEKRPGLEGELGKEGVSVAMPISHLSVLSNIDNIEHAIRSIQEYCHKERPVIGFDIVRSVGSRESNYRLLSRARAEELKSAYPHFSYIEWDQLIRRKADISHGKYKIHNGTIVGIDPSQF